jgi:hypothetical protein
MTPSLRCSGAMRPCDFPQPLRRAGSRLTAPEIPMASSIAPAEPIDKGGWNVFGTAFASFDMLNPATNRNLRAPGPNGYSIPGWASDETIEDLRKAWFAAVDEPPGGVMMGHCTLSCQSAS